MFSLFGKKQRDNPTTTGAINNDRYPSNEAGKPVPVFYGSQKLGPHFITDLFAVEQVPIYTNVQGAKIGPFRKGGKSVVTGYQYFASYAACLCMGTVSRLTKITAGDETIWEGDLTPASADGNGLTPIGTNYGTLLFYWGQANQGADSYLAGTFPASAYPHICYFVAQRFSFGRSPQPPRLEFYMERNPHPSLSGDAELSEVLADLLTNPIYGVGLPASLLDSASFAAAQSRLLSEGLGLSPRYDSAQGLRQILADLLQCANAACHYQGGKIQLILSRPDDTPGSLTLSESDLLEEPQIIQGTYSETWNETRVTFTNRARNYEDDFATHTDPANYAVTGQIQQKEFSRPFVTRPEVAAGMVQALGQTGGAPTGEVALIVKASRAQDTRPGTLFALNLPRLGLASLPLRVKEQQIGAPTEPQVSLTCEIVRSLPVLFTAPPVDPPVVITYPPPADVIMRLATLPSELLQGVSDGILLAPARPHPGCLSQRTYFNWNPSLEWLEIAGGVSFPVITTLNRWKTYGANILLDLSVTADWQSAEIDALRGNILDLRAVTLPWLNASTQPELQSAWMSLPYGGRFTLVAPRRWEIEVTPGLYSSTILSAASGHRPSTQLYLGRENDYTIFSTDALYLERAGANNGADTDWKRYFRVTTATLREEQELADAAQVYLDRNDTTQNANGTLNQNWGAPVTITSW